ncbi:hypothetical protein XENORESO_002908 [Xenotaenia resolanae]|uniref:Uncharacterized protein n=1 Tax=Xenotaenia resolanae TaxID=208358 RepID=A0ABV0X1E8_9TELE
MFFLFSVLEFQIHDVSWGLCFGRETSPQLHRSFTITNWWHEVLFPHICHLLLALSHTSGADQLHKNWNFWHISQSVQKYNLLWLKFLGRDRSKPLDSMNHWLEAVHVQGHQTLNK